MELDVAVEMAPPSSTSAGACKRWSAAYNSRRTPGALIGWLVLKETVGPRRIVLMALIALGAVIVEMGG